MSYYIDDENNYEESAYFTYSECECPHDPDDHGWCNCEITDCDCKACWEE